MNISAVMAYERCLLAFKTGTGKSLHATVNRESRLVQMLPSLLAGRQGVGRCVVVVGGTKNADNKVAAGGGR